MFFNNCPNRARYNMPMKSLLSSLQKSMQKECYAAASKSIISNSTLICLHYVNVITLYRDICSSVF